MYHSISDDPETGHPYYWINTSPACFEEHMRYLHDNGYTVISLSHAVNLLFGKQVETAKPGTNLSLTEGTGCTEEDKSVFAMNGREQHSRQASPGEADRDSIPNAKRCEASLVSDLPEGREKKIPVSPVISVGSSAAGERKEGGGSGSMTDNSSDLVPDSSNLQPRTSNLAPKYVVLTFDDGYRDFYTHAFPVLKKYGFTATVFLPTAYIDNNGKPGLKGKQHLTWDEVRELHDQGIDFGSHTVNHQHLVKSTHHQITKELELSKTIVEEMTGAPCSLFCYPFRFPEERGSFRQQLFFSLTDAGYHCNVTTRIGVAAKADGRFVLRRIPVNVGDDLRLLNGKLMGAYTWLSAPQGLLKRLKAALRINQIGA